MGTVEPALEGSKLYWVYIGVMEKKMETTFQGLGFRVLVLGFGVLGCGFRFWVCGLRLTLLGLGLRVLCLGLRV